MARLPFCVISSRLFKVALAITTTRGLALSASMLGRCILLMQQAPAVIPDYSHSTAFLPLPPP